MGESTSSDQESKSENESSDEEALPTPQVRTEPIPVPQISLAPLEFAIHAAVSQSGVVLHELAGIIAGYAASEFAHYAHGIHRDIPVSSLAHWQCIYDMPYSHQTNLTDFFIDADEYKYIFFGAVNTTDSASIYLGAAADVNTLFSDVTDVGLRKQQAHPIRGAYWYFLPEKSIGFSPDPDVFLYYADSGESHHRPYAKPESGELRLSWNLDLGVSTGGFRAGKHIDLGSEPGTWRKVVYVSNSIT